MSNKYKELIIVEKENKLIKRIGIRITQEEYDKLINLCDDSGLSISDIVRTLIKIKINGGK